MSTSSALTVITQNLPILTAAASASGIPVLAQLATIGQGLEAIVAAFQAASDEQRKLAGISDAGELDAAVEALLAQAEALNKASHGQ